MKNVVIHQVSDSDYFEIFVEGSVKTRIGTVTYQKSNQTYVPLSAYEESDIHAPIQANGKPLSRCVDLLEAAKMLYNIHMLNQSIAK